jgi:ribosome-binding factor A
MAKNQQSRKNNEAVKEALASIMLYDINDPRLETLTVSSVVVSGDRSVAKVYVLADRVDDSMALAGLAAAQGRIRSLLGAKLGWRQTPELRFFLDPMIEDTLAIAAVLRRAPETLAVEKDEAGYPIDLGELAGLDWGEDPDEADAG